jgi:hypothetical protein
LIVRRVRRLNPDTIPDGQGTLFGTRRHHAAFTNAPLCLPDAERDHRRHAVVEQVSADLRNGPLAHAPSGHLQANAAWLALAALAHHLTRTAGTLAGTFPARAPTTIRDHLINVPARPAASPSTCPNAGPGSTTSPSSSTPRTRRHPPPEKP